MQVTTAFCVTLILFVTVEACSPYKYSPKTQKIKKPVETIADSVTEETSNERIETEDNVNEGTKAAKSAIKKNGNIYISDCYLRTMKPGEVKTKMLSNRDTKLDDEMPVNQNLFVWDSKSTTERPKVAGIINNINSYTVTVKTGHSGVGCAANDKCLTKITKVIEIKANDTFKKVQKGNVPPYTIMGENWNFYITDCYLDSNFASGSIENIYIRDGESAMDSLTKQMTITNSKRYNIRLRSLNYYDHCIADALCWPKEKRFIDIKLY